ncbi:MULTISPECIES: hypothetical protein [Ramlibacter]|uniref:Uncharacterized protein n=1 Tax=Ramlibacter pinisoli TaxID=2682844 RepID=A0A6N8IZ43_9BURK|nr:MULTISPECIES: hypothetical protein [Ramlibacter]MBA2962165.1 hypothetical protein [Ramlibacter sp. CGMCC 1.13660]MVQ32107.1 hypothetical protein [Ramlibacter pinisoli]
MNAEPSPGQPVNPSAPPIAPDEPAAAAAVGLTVPIASPWPARFWKDLRFGWARQLGVAAVVLGTLAAVGHFVGGMIGWWHAYEVTFGALHKQESVRSQKSATPGTTPPVSMVVLPLSHVGGADDEWFTDALTGDLTTELGRITNSLVIARDTAFTYKGRAADPRQVARELGVRYVVNGSARRTDQRVRLSLSIVDGEFGSQRWAQNFDFDRSELSSSFDNIAQQIARALWMEIYRSAGERASKLKPHEVEADDLAMQGWGFWFRGITPENVAGALRACEQAVAKDSRSIRGWGCVAAMSGTGRGLGFAADKDAARRQLEEATARLQQLDPNDFFAINSRVQIANMNGDWETALRIATDLADRFPSEPSGHQHQAVALLSLGRFEQSISAAERALRISRLDPRVGIWYFVIAADQFNLERYADAAENSRRSLIANPALPLSAGMLAASLVRSGRQEDGRKVLQDHLSRNPGFNAAFIQASIRSTEPDNIAGRDRMIASLREIGLP